MINNYFVLQKHVNLKVAKDGHFVDANDPNLNTNNLKKTKAQQQSGFFSCCAATNTKSNKDKDMNDLGKICRKPSMR